MCIDAVKLSDYKPCNSTHTVTDVSFLNELNYFYACFDNNNKETATKITLSAYYQTLKLTSTDVYTALSRINTHKAAGPDGNCANML